MARFETPNANAYATADRAGQPVINDHEWPVEVKANGDLIKIGELPAYHQLAPELCSILALADGAAQLAAMNVDLLVGDDPTAAVAVVDNLAVTADTEARTAFSTHLPGYKLGVSQVNRAIWLLLNTAPASAEGKIVARIASFTKS